MAQFKGKILSVNVFHNYTQVIILLIAVIINYYLLLVVQSPGNIDQGCQKQPAAYLVSIGQLLCLAFLYGWRFLNKYPRLGHLL